MNQKRESYPFPFFGAGEANYFEETGLTIAFAAAPPDHAREQVLSLAPEPLREYHEWNGRFLTLASSCIHPAIIAAYSSEESEHHDPEDEYLEDDNSYEEASSEDISRFNADIEAWLERIHPIAPVRLAVRHEDEEAGGTEFNDWHEWSLDHAEQALSSFPLPGEQDADDNATAAVGKHLASAIITMTIEAGREQTIPRVWMEWYDLFSRPEEKAASLFQDGKSEELQRHIRLVSETNAKGIPYILQAIAGEYAGAEDAGEKKKRTETLVAIAPLILTLEGDAIHPTIFPALIEAIWRGGEIGHGSPSWTNARIQECLATNKSAGEYLGYTASQKLMQDGDYALALELFELAVPLKLDDLSVYCNALYAAQNDNSHLGVDRHRNSRLLSRCLPCGNRNPSIHYNAACLYVEMEEYQNALDQLELAVQHGCKNVLEAEHHPFFQALHQYARFQSIFKADRPPSPLTNVEEAKRRLATGTDVNAPDENGDPLLLKACREGDLETVQFLLSNGADLRPGQTESVVLYQKQLSRHRHVSAGKEMPLTAAAMNNHSRTVQYLIERGAAIDEQDRYGRSALQLATWNGNEDLVAFLLSSGADVNILDISAKTPLMAAATKGSTGIAGQLLDAGALVNEQNEMGETALMNAVLGGHTGIVQTLLARGADPSIKDAQGETALQKARTWELTEMIRILEAE